MPTSPAAPAERWAIVFDGGSLGNPGRGYGSYRLKQGDGPWSAIVRLEHGARITNNEAEYRTLIGALDALLSQVPEARAVDLEVRGDSQLVLKQLAGEWKVRAGNLVADHARARELVGRFGRVRYAWQPRERSVALLGH